MIQQKFLGYIEQKNFAMEAARHDYVLSLDADERLSEAMRDEILKVKTNWQGDAYAFDRLNNYGGVWLRFVASPDRKTRLWDRRKGRWGGENPHDKVMVDGRIQKLKGKLIHYAYRDLMAFYEQNLKFARIAAEAKYARGKKANMLWHVILSSVFKFVRLYFFKLGFLDGAQGFVFSVMSAYTNFAKYSRLRELNRRGKDYDWG